jgi:hypothetical protein
VARRIIKKKKKLLTYLYIIDPFKVKSTQLAFCYSGILNQMINAWRKQEFLLEWEKSFPSLIWDKKTLTAYTNSDRYLVTEVRRWDPHMLFWWGEGNKAMSMNITASSRMWDMDLEQWSIHLVSQPGYMSDTAV